jgi:hypothetical protein
VKGGSGSEERTFGSAKWQEMESFGQRVEAGEKIPKYKGLRREKKSQSWDKIPKCGQKSWDNFPNGVTWGGGVTFCFEGQT